MKPRPLVEARSLLAFVALVLALVTFVSSALGGDMIGTGEGVRTKSFGPFSVKIYAIRHEMKERPAAKSRDAVIAADVDKRFTLRLLRDCPTAKIQSGLRESLALNGYADQAKIDQFLRALDKKEFPENTSVVIAYDAASKTTSIRVQGGGTASVVGPEFMRGIWSIWFGKIDQRELGDQLMARL